MKKVLNLLLIVTLFCGLGIYGDFLVPDDAYAATVGDKMTFEGNNTYSGTSTFTGTETHSGTETHTGTVTHSGSVTFGTISPTTIDAGCTNAQVLISDGTDLACQSLSGDITTTNAGVVSIEAGTDGQVLIYNATEKWGPKSLSGDGTISNAGVLTIGDNKIGTAELNVSTKIVEFFHGQTSNTTTVTAGSTIMAIYPFANITAATLANKAAISGTTLTITLSAAAAPGAGTYAQYKVVVLEP